MSDGSNRIITQVRVRYCECDPMSVAHHSAYPIWFEIGRTELYRRQAQSYRDLETDGTFLAVTRLDVRYHAPARYDDELELETTLVRCGRAKLIHEYLLTRDGIRLTTGTTTLACLGRDGRPCALPESLRNG